MIIVYGRDHCSHTRRFLELLLSQNISFLYCGYDPSRESVRQFWDRTKPPSSKRTFPVVILHQEGTQKTRSWTQTFPLLGSLNDDPRVFAACFFAKYPRRNLFACDRYKTLGIPTIKSQNLENLDLRKTFVFCKQ